MSLALSFLLSYQASQIHKYFILNTEAQTLVLVLTSTIISIFQIIYNVSSDLTSFCDQQMECVVYSLCNNPTAIYEPALFSLMNSLLSAGYAIPFLLTGNSEEGCSISH